MPATGRAPDVATVGGGIVGEAPWADGMWVVAGHGPWGISTGLAPVPAASIPIELAVGRFGSPGGTGGGDAREGAR